MSLKLMSLKINVINCIATEARNYGNKDRGIEKRRN